MGTSVINDFPTYTKRSRLSTRSGKRAFFFDPRCAMERSAHEVNFDMETTEFTQSIENLWWSKSCSFFAVRIGFQNNILIAMWNANPLFEVRYLQSGKTSILYLRQRCIIESACPSLVFSYIPDGEMLSRQTSSKKRIPVPLRAT